MSTILSAAADHFCNAGENFAVVDLDGDTNAEAGEDFVDNLHEFDLIEERIGTDDVGIALVELAIAAFLRTIGAPNGLDLVALEGEGEFFAVLHDKTGEGHGEIVAKSLLAELGGEGGCRGGFVVGGGNGAGEVAAVEDFEEEFVPFFTILAHEGGEVLHGGRFDLAKAVKTVDAADGVEDIIAARHFDKAEIAGAFRNCGFLCHGAVDNVWRMERLAGVFDEENLRGQVVGVAVEPCAAGGSAFGRTFVLAFGLQEVISREDGVGKEVEARFIGRVEEIAGEDDLIEEIPLASIVECADSFLIEHVVPRIVEIVRSAGVLVALGTEGFGRSDRKVAGIVVEVAHDDNTCFGVLLEEGFFQAAHLVTGALTHRALRTARRPVVDDEIELLITEIAFDRKEAARDVGGVATTGDHFDRDSL